MYLDPRKHAAFTGSPVSIAARVGAPFRAFGGALSGTILHLVPNRLIVQSWRSKEFARRDLESTLVLGFWPEKGRAYRTHPRQRGGRDSRASRRLLGQVLLAPWRPT
jgi:hypothetical protein